MIADSLGASGLHRLKDNFQLSNTRSIALAHRTGFQREGFLPRFLFIDGAWCDHERWVLLADANATAPAAGPAP